MEKQERQSLCSQLEAADWSRFFLLVILASVLLSYCGVEIGRQKLCLMLEGDEKGAAALPNSFPLRITAGALVVGALGFFLCLAWRTWQESVGGEGEHSALVNLWASLFVLLAALLRLGDLLANREGQGEDADLPS